MYEYYGTSRGQFRFLLAEIEVGLGFGAIRTGPPEEVRRLIFLCHGNVCRSAFAHFVAQEAGLNVHSFGLSAVSGRPAHWPMIEEAAKFGYDLTGHRARPVEIYTPRQGDMLLAMETRQLRQIAAEPRLSGPPRSLLGLYARPRAPHLHDPYGLSDDYMRMCLARIENAVAGLKAAFPNAHAGTPT